MNRIIHPTMILLSIVVGARAADEQTCLLLTGARIVDLTAGALIEGHDVLIVGERMVSVGPSAQIEAPEGAMRLDLTGLTLVPGLIDLHSHLLLHPYDEASWTDQVLR